MYVVPSFWWYKCVYIHTHMHISIDTYICTHICICMYIYIFPVNYYTHYSWFMVTRSLNGLLMVSSVIIIYKFLLTLLMLHTGMQCIYVCMYMRIVYMHTYVHNFHTTICIVIYCVEIQCGIYLNWYVAILQYTTEIVN